MYGLMIEKVTDVKRPLVFGELYLVPCFVKHNGRDAQDITPVILLPHNDIENGQKEIHYHLDTRFYIGNTKLLRPEDNAEFGDLEWVELPVINERFEGSTPTNDIGKSKLKHKCIHKGKCPHRGYDLSQVKPVNTIGFLKNENGIIKCPLHGLLFDAKTKKLIE